MLKPILGDSGNSCILVKGTVKLKYKVTEGQTNNAANKNVIFKNCVPI